MQSLLNFLVLYQNWIYTVLILVGLIYLRKLIHAIIEWRSTIFGLERESAQHKLNTSLAMVIVTVLLLLVEFISVTFVINELPQTPSLSPQNNLTGNGLDTGILSTAVIPSGGDAGLPPVSAQPEISQVVGGCMPGMIEWIKPQPGEEISGVYELQATLNVQDMGFYKYQYALLGDPDNWHAISAGSTPIVASRLGVLATTEIQNGDYLLRLIVVDKSNRELEPCDVAIRILNETQQ